VGLIFDIQRFAIHDGAGIRTLVFLKGCPLRCQWCQNPESMIPVPEIVFHPQNCIAAGRCLSICPEGAIQASMEVKRVIDRQRCTLCGQCVEACYAGAINILGRYLTLDQVLAEVERDRKFYRRSDGGVTFSGGEPTAQPAFVEAALRSAHERDLHTAIETRVRPLGHVPAILRHVDGFADLNIWIHDNRRLTGAQ
jgi:pyruvate formate lyase activating enzyme